MSIEIAQQTLALKSAARPAHTEFIMNYELMELVTSEINAAGSDEVQGKFYDMWDVDFLWYTNDGPIGWDKRGRITDMGHAVFKADGSDKRDTIKNPFNDVEEVLAFDAVSEYGLDDPRELAEFYGSQHRLMCKKFPNQLIPGGYYHTMVTGATLAFGWDLLLEAAASQDKFETVLDSFYRLASHHARAWAATDIEVFICHDDMVWTSGPFMSPDFYRRAIIPRYKQLWAILKQAGKKVLYCCDGDWSMFAGDIVDAGADGFIFEPAVPFEMMTKEFGQSHVLVGSNVDCRTLTFSDPQNIEVEVAESLRLGLACPGWICAVANHIAPNVPPANAIAYFKAMSDGWKR